MSLEEVAKTIRIWQIEFFDNSAKYNIATEKAEDAILMAKKYAGKGGSGEGLYAVNLVAEGLQFE